MGRHAGKTQGAKACKRSLEDLFDNPVSGKRPRAGSESKATTMTRSEAVAKSTRQAQSRKAGKSESKASVVAKSTGQFQSRTAAKSESKASRLEAAPRRVGAQSRRLKILPQKQKRPPVRQTNKKRTRSISTCDFSQLWILQNMQPNIRTQRSSWEVVPDAGFWFDVMLGKMSLQRMS